MTVRVNPSPDTDSAGEVILQQDQSRRRSLGMRMDAPLLPELEDVDDHIWPVLDRLARALHVPGGALQPTLDAIVHTAVGTVSPADHAGLLVLVKGRVEPTAVTGEPPRVLDEFQQRRRTGPCVDAAAEQVVIRIEDCASEPRWPQFAELACSLGTASMLCVPLSVDRTRLGTLSLYASRPGAFDEIHLRIAELYATHAALALADANRTEQLSAALHNRDTIGQAKGILMERHRLTAEAAFDLLSAASQASNRKLIVIASHLVDTGELLDGN
jgi:GAF domain-containing protein